MSEGSFIQYNVENKQLKEENKKLKKENENEERQTRNEKLETRNEKLETTNENKQFGKNKIIKEEPKEIKSSNWFNKKKFKEILVIIDSNKFNYKYRIGKFKYTDIENLVNNIKNNTISEIDAKKYLNKLNEIKNVEIIKYKKRTPGHKKLLNLFNKLLNIILTDKTLETQKNKKQENEYENEDEDENEKVKSKKEENEDYENKDEDDDETIDQNKIIKEKNDGLDKITDKSKSFKDQIESLKKVKNLYLYYYDDDFGDKELKFKIFKLRLAYCKLRLRKSYLKKYLVIHL